jgi:predicted ATPase
VRDRESHDAFHASDQNDPVLIPLAILKGARYTMQYGLSEHAPAILSLAGLLLAGTLGDFASAKVYADQALALAENNRCVQARVIFVTHQFVLHWQIPAEVCKKQFRQGYTIGMKTGDTESACWSICSYLEMTFHTAGSLGSLLTDCQAYSRQIQDVKQHRILISLKVWWQLTLNLTSSSLNSSTLSGEILDEDALIHHSEETKDVHLKQQFDRIKMYSAFWFGDHEAVVKMMFETRTEKYFYEKSNPGLYGVCPLYFHCALSCISMARTTKQNRYKRIAMKFMKKIRGWVKKGVSFHNAASVYCHSS